MKRLSRQELEEITSKLEAESSPNSSPAASTPRHRPLLPADRGATLAELQDALSHISPDVPRGTGCIIGPDNKPVDDYWFGVILAIRRELDGDGEAVAREWSQQSARYTEEGFNNAWGAFDPAHSNPVTLSSVFMLARESGWSAGAQPSQRPLPSTSRYRLLDRDEIMALAPIQWRVKGLFPTTGVGAIYGSSGSGKSFLAIDLSARIASGEMWFGHRTVVCPVTYVMLEGEAGLHNRIDAWQRHNGSSISGEFRGVIQAFSLADPQDVEDLAASVPSGGVVILDTLNRAAPGLDENSSKDMGQILAGMKRLQEVTGGLVLVVHHTGKDASKGMRGHSSLHAGLDGAIEVERKLNSRTWSAAKVKDGLDGQAVSFKLHVLMLGTDADGDEITSCAISPDLEAVFAPKEPSGKHQKAALSSIRRAINVSPQTGIGDCRPNTACMMVEDAIAEVASTLTAVVVAKRRHNARRIVGGLIDGGYLQSGLDANEDAWLWLR